MFNDNLQPGLECMGKEASIALPENAREGDDVTLYCKYDIKGSRLREVKWLINGEEFVSSLIQSVDRLQRFTESITSCLTSLDSQSDRFRRKTISKVSLQSHRPPSADRLECQYSRAAH